MLTDERPYVVYVDDEPINLRVFEANFRDRYRLATFASPVQALEFITQRASEVGVLVTDQRMPQMSGVQLLEKVRAVAPDAQRMMLTAFADIKAMADAVNLGQVARYFGKPWVKEELAGAIEDALRIFTLQGEMRKTQARMSQSERLAAIGLVSAGVAHEIMNPVGFVYQNAATLHREMEDLRAYVRRALREVPDEKVSRSVEDLPQLVDDLKHGAELLRDVATRLRDQARGTAPDPKVTSDLAKAVAFAVKIARAEVGKRARIVADSHSLMVRGAEHQICQVLLNLIVNSAHAIESAGRAGLIEVRWAQDSEAVVLSVVDNGCGIPPENLERVFEPMFTTKAPGVGTGLGLPICRELVHELGGTLALRSEVGVGTTAEIRLRPTTVE
jgi:signal transduction histidine kinase